MANVAIVALLVEITLGLQKRHDLATRTHRAATVRSCFAFNENDALTFCAGRKAECADGTKLLCLMLGPRGMSRLPPVALCKGRTLQ